MKILSYDLGATTGWCELILDNKTIKSIKFGIFNSSQSKISSKKIINNIAQTINQYEYVYDKAKKQENLSQTSLERPIKSAIVTGYLSQNINQQIKTFQPDIVAYEDIIFSKFTRATLALGSYMGLLTSLCINEYKVPVIPILSGSHKFSKKKYPQYKDLPEKEFQANCIIDVLKKHNTGIVIEDLLQKDYHNASDAISVGLCFATHYSLLKN